MTENETDVGERLRDGGTSGDKALEKADSVRELLELTTQETRFALIQDLVAHPEGMPSLKELVYANPKKSKSTIRNHLEKLIEAGIVETVELPKEQRHRDLPHKFYRLSPAGREFLEEHELLRSEETLKEMYSMLEKTPIEDYVEAPRPGDGDEEPDEPREELKP